MRSAADFSSDRWTSAADDEAVNTSLSKQLIGGVRRFTRRFTSASQTAVSDAIFIW